MTCRPELPQKCATGRPSCDRATGGHCPSASPPSRYSPVGVGGLPAAAHDVALLAPMRALRERAPTLGDGLRIGRRRLRAGAWSLAGSPPASPRSARMYCFWILQRRTRQMGGSRQRIRPHHCCMSPISAFASTSCRRASSVKPPDAASPAASARHGIALDRVPIAAMADPDRPFVEGSDVAGA